MIMKNLDLSLIQVEETSEKHLLEVNGGIYIFQDTIYQDGFYKPIWYSTDLGGWVTNSDLWIGYA